VPFYVWWLIPLVATLAAIAVLSWRARDRPVDPHDSVAERLRFEQAMKRPPARRGRPPVSGDEPDVPGERPHGSPS
jgi:hypothetical protein